MRTSALLLSITHGVGADCNMTLDPIDKVRNGDDYDTLEMQGTHISECTAACCADPKCKAVSFNTDSKYCPNGWSSCCKLKSGKPKLEKNNYGSAVRTAVYASDPTPPVPTTAQLQIGERFNVPKNPKTNVDNQTSWDLEIL